MSAENLADLEILKSRSPILKLFIERELLCGEINSLTGKFDVFSHNARFDFDKITERLGFVGPKSTPYYLRDNETFIKDCDAYITDVRMTDYPDELTKIIGLKNEYIMTKTQFESKLPDLNKQKDELDILLVDVDKNPAIMISLAAENKELIEQIESRNRK